MPIFAFYTATAQPNWIQKISDIHVAIEDSVSWECRASGRPRPTYRWLKNGEPLFAQVSKQRLPRPVPTVMSKVALLLWKQGKNESFPK